MDRDETAAELTRQLGRLAVEARHLLWEGRNVWTPEALAVLENGSAAIVEAWRVMETSRSEAVARVS